MATGTTSKAGKSTPTTISVESAEINTPISKGDKRIATSPLDALETDLKKVRHQSQGSSANMSGEDDTTGVTVGDDDGSLHFFSRPMNPDDIVNMATELRSLMLPEIGNLIKGQLPDIQSVVRAEVQKATTTLKEEIRNLREENANLRKVNDDLAARLDMVENQNDALEQYTRRNSVRISGYPEQANENTDVIVLTIAEALDVQLVPSDIDRSHRVGKLDQATASAKPRHRDIIVKFATHNARQRLYMKRKDLRDKDELPQLFINEDLTKIRSKLLYDARSLARASKLKYAYSSDGKIFICDNSDQRHLVKSGTDVLKYGDPVEARRELSRGARPERTGRAVPRQ